MRTDLGEIKVEKTASKQPANSKPNNSGTAQKPSVDNKPTDNQTQTEQNTPTEESNKPAQKEESGKNENVDNTPQDTPAEEEGEIDYVKGYAKEGWYKDFLGFNITVQKDATLSVAGSVTEGQFIHTLARLCGFNSNHYADNTMEEKAVSWAKMTRIAVGNVNIANPISQENADKMISVLFDK